jgi:hypothetical protein
LRSAVIVYSKFEDIKEVVEALSSISKNIYLTQNIKSVTSCFELGRVDLLIVDVEMAEIPDFETEIIFLKREDRIYPKNIDILDRVTLLEHIIVSQEVTSSDIISVKKENVFRSRKGFEKAIKSEVRRAKRYRYPFVVVMFKVSSEVKDMETIVQFFASKIREFDSLWVSGKDTFSLILPHTGWDGAEILTNRLTTDITNRLEVTISALKNHIFSFKRVENDVDFISRIENNLDGEYFDIRTEIDFDIWKDELFSEFIEGKTIRTFNRYKGMLISHDADMLSEEGKLKLYNIRPLQLSIIDKEKATYFHSSTLNKTIRAGVEKISRNSSNATLTNFELIDSSFIKNTTFKLLIEEKISDIKIDGKAISGDIYELSLDEVTIISKAVEDIKKGDSIKLEFTIPTNSYYVSTEASVQDIEKGTNTSFIDLIIKTSLSDNMKISEFLANKQIEFIKELKDIP